MGKPIETKINRFDGGISTTLRNGDFKYASMVANYDIFSDPNRLLPHRDLDDDTLTDYTAANAKICKFLAATNAAQNGTLLYGLGVVTGQLYAKIFSRTMPNTAWAEVHASTAQDTVARDENVFIEYKNLLYGWSRVDGTNARIWSFAITTGTFTSSARSSAALNAATSVVQGLVHSKDDILYLPYNTAAGTFIAKNNNGSWTDAALTLPTNCFISSICEYGNYLAVATRPRIAGGQSIVYLWDRDASLTTLSEKINWGNEELFLIEELNGYLIGVSLLSTYSSYAYGGTVTSPRAIIKSYGGGLSGTTVVKELLLTTGDIVISTKQKANNLLYFMMSCNLNSVQYDAIWTFGISTTGTWALTIDRLLNNGTAITTCIPKGFAIIGDRIFAAYTDNSAYILERTTAAENPWANASAVYETLIVNDGDSSLTKKLLGVEVIFEPLPAAGQVVLKYKKDEDIDGTTWTTIYTFGTDDAISHGSVNIESSGATLPEYKEIMFRIESTGNAHITGWKYKSEIIDKQLF